MSLDRTLNAAQIFFDQARREELKDRPRLMVPGESGWEPVTWGVLSGKVQRLASFLMDRGVDAGTNVAVLSSTTVEWGQAALAILAARGSLVPVYPTLTAEHLEHILGHAEVDVLLVESPVLLSKVLQVWRRLDIRTLITFEAAALDDLVRDAGLNDEAGDLARDTFSLQDAEDRGQRSLQREPDRVLERTRQIQLSDVAYLVYTSGTTGLPKGVPLTHRNIGASGAAWMEVNGHLVAEGNRDILWLPMSHLYGLGEFFLGNQVGFETYISDPIQVMKQLPEVRPHVFMSVPAYWEKLMVNSLAPGDDGTPHARLRTLTGGRLRFCLSGGAGLARSIKEFFLEAGMMIIEGYGLTECSPNLTMNLHDDFDFDSVGKPVPGVEIEIAPDGEILARGDNIFSGYLKDEEATRSVFDEDGWFHTGDLGRFTGDGFLQIIGRKKEILVTSGGKNIPPANIEQRFNDLPLIAHLMVYGDGKKYLTALVDIDEREALNRLKAAGSSSREPRTDPMVIEWVQTCVDAVNQDLPRHETIKAFAISSSPLTVEGQMLTPTLKLRRKEISERFFDQLEALYG